MSKLLSLLGLTEVSRRVKLRSGSAYIVALVLASRVTYRRNQVTNRLGKSLSVPVLTRLSSRVKVILFVALVIAIGMMGTVIYWQLFMEKWVEWPVMLRIIDGEVEIYAADKGEAAVAADRTWLEEGDHIRAKPDSLAALQFFDGSEVFIEGPAELYLSSSRFQTEQYPGDPRLLRLDVFQGKIIVAATTQGSTRSIFEIRAPSSVGRVQSTLFELEVREGEGDIWVVSRGTVAVGAMTPDRDLNAAVASIALNAGDSLAVASLPEIWWLDLKTYAKLATTASDIVAKSIREGHSDVQVRGASSLAFNPETGNAVSRVEKVVSLAPRIAAARQFPADYEPVEDEVLEHWVPGVALASRSVLASPFVPTLAIPEAWAQPPASVERKRPPSYLFSIPDVVGPMGVAVDPAGQRIVVTQGGGDQDTIVYGREGNQLMVLAPPGTAAAERDPFYVAIDRMGTMYVSDRKRRTIDMYDANGVYLGAFANRDSSDMFWSPLGLAIDFNDNIYVTDVTDLKHRVMVFDRSGRLKLEFGKQGDGDGEFAFPNDVAIGREGMIYVADSNNYRIQVFDVFGQFLGALGGLGFPRGLEIEGPYLYVVDTFGHSVGVYDLSQGASQLFAFGGLGIGDSEFNFPNGFALDSTGRLYITDRENNRVQVWSY